MGCATSKVQHVFYAEIGGRAGKVYQQHVNGIPPAAEKVWAQSRRERPAGRAELLANAAIRSQILAASIQTPHGLTNFEFNFD